MEYTDVIIVAVILGLVEVLKTLGLTEKFAPVASIALGIMGGVIYLYPQDLKAGILMGLIMGLSASGAYSGTKTLLEKKINK